MVAFYTDASYNLARSLGSWFRLHSNFNPQHTLLNSTHLTSKLNQITFPVNTTIHSFDIIKMFTCIPVTLCITYMCDLLSDNHVHPDTVAEFRTLITICLKHNLCFYRDILYTFPDGLPMGAPLSSLVADVFMNHFETDLIHNTVTPHPHLLAWYRYVDDVFCAWTGPPDELKSFLSHLNSIHPSIQFTLEIGGASLNYLDLSITLSPSSPSSHFLTPAYSIYRKASNTGIFINGLSFHHVSHKYAAFHSLIHRLLSIPLSSHNFKTEADFISELARRNSIHLNVNKVIARKSLKRAMQSIPTLQKRESPPTIRPKWVRMPFLGTLSYRVARLLKTRGYKTAFYSLLTLGHLSNPKDLLPLEERSGVYRADCTAPNCSGTYIGQTGRTLRDRRAEHRHAYDRSTPEKSAVAKHCIDSGHNFDHIKFQLLHNATKGRLLNKLEEVEIASASTNNDVNLLNDIRYDHFNSFISHMFNHDSSPSSRSY